MDKLELTINYICAGAGFVMSLLQVYREAITTHNIGIMIFFSLMSLGCIAFARIAYKEYKNTCSHLPR